VEEDAKLASSIRRAREERSDRAAGELLRALLSAYQARFDELDRRRFRLRSQRTLTGRFLTGHVRETVTTLERVLHRASAVEGGTAARSAMLEDLAHFRSALEPPLSAFTRTLIVVLIAFVAQLLGHLPLIPVASGPESKPALGSLSEAVDMDPGHVARALADLLGSPISTICGAAATAAAAAFLVLGQCIPAFRGKQKLVERMDLQISEFSTRVSIEDLERQVFSKLSAAVPGRRRADRLLWWCVAAFAVSLGVAWYAAYARGLFRETLSSRNWAALSDLRGSLPAVLLREPAVIVRTEHPRMLAVGGVLFIFFGVLIALVLISRERGWSFDRVAASSRRRLIRAVAAGGVGMVALSIVSVSGFSSFELPWARSYDDPRLEVRTDRLRLLSLVARPMIPLRLRCRPKRCTIDKATIAGGISANRVDPLLPGIAVSIDRTLRSDEQLPKKRLTADEAARRLGLPERLFRDLRLPPDRVAVEQTTLVQVTRQVGVSIPVQLAAVNPRLPLRSGDLTSNPFTTGSNLAARREILIREIRSDEFAIALGDDDLRRLLAASGRTSESSVASLEMSVRMRGKAPREIRLPLPLLWV
jgi:hypothetical protein